ncbi:initiation-specific alpha-1,6-mannosyltransferase [Xylariales sp. AK1849]|nr:initiation-specific alpha-1,6-mannosyltransferase [Xylariales sp. AK1849]
MNTPLTPLSPRLASSTAKWRNRVPTQMRRLLPIYALCVCLILVLLNVDILPSRSRPNVFKRNAAKQKPLKGHDGTGFPKKIWQTWKTDPFAFEERDSSTAKTWVMKNPGYRYEVLTDDNDLGYVEEKYGPGGFDRPDIIEMYRTVNATIIKADLLRYLIMYAEGGLYADIDVEALRPVHRFIPERYDESEMDLVIGVEIDQPDFKDHPILGKKSQSFCQWTFMAKPRQPVMLRLVENIMTWLNDVAYNQKVSVSEIVLNFDEVISGTGPSAFTIAVLEEMSAHNGGKRVTWDDFHDLDESKIVSRILVQNVEAFAAGQGHSDSGNHNSRGALVKHHYHASNWPSRHARFAHPVYGEVERCNWNPDCVRTWDADVAAFAELSPEEQQQKMAEPKPEPMAPGIPAIPAFPPVQPEEPVIPAAPADFMAPQEPMAPA